MLVMFFGCTERVPPGYVGMVMEPGGLTGEVLEPGNHTCFNRDRMVLIETKEETKTEQLSVLCKDDLNFKFDLKVRPRLKTRDSKGIISLLNLQGANIRWDGVSGTLKFNILYNNYVQPVARSIARGIVSKYDTTQIRENREAITNAIQTQLTEAVQGTPMEIVMVTTSNFDYPDVITHAVEKKRQKEIEIDEEKAKQAMELLRADNRLKIAQKLKIVRVAEAEAEAVYVKILGQALTERYLQMKNIEAKRTLYEKAGVGDKVIVSNGNPVIPMVNSIGAAINKQ